MNELCNFTQAHCKVITIFALVLALLGTALLAWDFIQWSNIKRAKANSEYGIAVSITENIAKQKWGSMLIGISIIVQLLVTLCKN